MSSSSSWSVIAASKAAVVDRRRRYWYWSSIMEKACFMVKAFLISFAVTYGYSPYSRKLGRW